MFDNLKKAFRQWCDNHFEDGESVSENVIQEDHTTEVIVEQPDISEPVITIINSMKNNPEEWVVTRVENGTLSGTTSYDVQNVVKNFKFEISAACGCRYILYRSTLAWLTQDEKKVLFKQVGEMRAEGHRKSLKQERQKVCKLFGVTDVQE